MDQSERGKYKYKERKTEINTEDEGKPQAVESQHVFKNTLLFHELRQNCMDFKARTTSQRGVLASDTEINQYYLIARG
jgi:hypothetical protein